MLTLSLIFVIWLVYSVELWLAGGIGRTAASPVAREIVKSWIGPSVAFLIHSYHGHIAVNSVYLLIGGSIVEPHLEPIEYVTAIILGGWFTTLVPSLFTAGGVGLSGVTNQLLTFAALLIFYATKGKSRTVEVLKRLGLILVFSIILLLSVIAVPEGSSVAGHILGIIVGIGWFAISQLRGSLSLEEVSSSDQGV
jgi:membrane associated rhomboid family serine protease